MRRPNTRLNLKKLQYKQSAFFKPVQKTVPQLQNTKMITVQIVNATKVIDRDIHFFSGLKDPQVCLSVQKLKVRPQGQKDVDVRLQSKHQGQHIEDESYQAYQKNMNFFANQQEYMIYKGGPVSSEKKYLKSLMEIDYSRPHIQFCKEDHSASQRIKQEDSSPIEFLVAERQQQNHIFFFKEPYEIPYSKLLWFKPNAKNGRNIVYNPQHMKCQAIFKCEGCLKTFEVPSALGGHLSRCQKKNQHFQNIAQKSIVSKVSKREFRKRLLRLGHRQEQQILFDKIYLNQQQQRSCTELQKRRPKRKTRYLKKNQQNRQKIIIPKAIKRAYKRKRVEQQQKSEKYKKLNKLKVK